MHKSGKVLFRKRFRFFAQRFTISLQIKMTSENYDTCTVFSGLSADLKRPCNYEKAPHKHLSLSCKPMTRGQVKRL